MAGTRLGLFTTFAIALVLSAGVASSSAIPKPQTLSFLEINTTFAGIGGFNPMSEAPPAAGQGLTFTSTLFKWAGTKKGAPLGHDQVVCTVTNVDVTAQSVQLQCSATVFLPGGGIQLAG